MYSRSSVSLHAAVVFAFLSSFVTADLGAQENEVTYDRDVRPILSDRCFACHGPDAETREAGLRLDVADGDEGSHQAAITPGSLEDSELWNRIISDDEYEVMPPPDAHKKPISDSERKLIKRWIEAGAKYEKFWAFTPPRKQTAPQTEPAVQENPVDPWVLSSLKKDGLEFSSTADPRILIRRVTFDLTGLPPTPEEIQDFLAERKTIGNERAWTNLVDGLLIRPQFGEHMARYWLDLVRFADTNGMHKDFYRNHVEYRDWVIRAFNENLGYDDFIMFQLAGDLFEQPTDDQLIASGFHRLHLVIDRGTALPEESLNKNVIDRVTSVGTAFLGLTVHCAQCHDHKYDPITQEDFYALSAFFNNIDAQPETVANPRRGLQPPFVSLGSSDEKKKLRALDAQLTKWDKKIAAHEKLITAEQARCQSGDSDRPIVDGNQNPKVISKRLTKLTAQLEAIQKKRDLKKQERTQFDQTIRYAMVMKERSEVRPTFILIRGQYDSPGDEVTRDTPGFLPPLNKNSEVATRKDLAQWLVRPDHPLTARVAVNRFWQQFFGVGLVKTSEDFGAQGGVPSHPALLDNLSVGFVESGWDTKCLIRKMVLSKTYQQSSRATPAQFREDPENRLLARGSRFRLDAEMMRDQILATSGLINPKMYGPSVKPPQPDGLWKAVTMTGERFHADEGDSIYRRSIYTFWKRAMPPPQMTIMNAPNRDACIARRERTNTPSQALLLLNETEYFKAARQLALKTLNQQPSSRVSYMWEVVTSRVPDENERLTVTALLLELKQKYEKEPSLADDICSGVDCIGSMDKSELAAWTVIGNTLYNLDIAKTRE